MQINYSSLPEHMHGAAHRYIEEGLRPGDFLQVVLENDLVQSFGCADTLNLMAMQEWVHWLYNEIPSTAWGSPAKVRVWMKSGGYKGQQAARAASLEAAISEGPDDGTSRSGDEVAE